jgi:hypothetical protein
VLNLLACLSFNLLGRVCATYGCAHTTLRSQLLATPDASRFPGTRTSLHVCLAWQFRSLQCAIRAFYARPDVLPSLANSRERMSSLSPPEPEHVIRKCTCRSSLVCFLSLVSKATIESGSRYTNPIGRIREGMSCVATSCSAAVQLFTGTTETNVSTPPLTQLSCIVLGRGHACRGALLLCIIDLAFW